jgi:hypothetical protein
MVWTVFQIGFGVLMLAGILTLVAGAVTIGAALLGERHGEVDHEQ